MSDALRRVFISYARADSLAFVDRLERDLQSRQFQTWVDRHGLEGGEEWMEIIQQAIDECLALVVVLSPAAVQSKFVRMEYRYASEIGKLVIPARYLATTTTPMDLRILQWVDFQSDYDEGLRQLAHALSRLKGIAAPQSEPAIPKAQPAPAPAFPLIKPMPARASEAPAKTKEQWLDEGIAHENAQRYEQALAAYEHAIQLDPNYPIAWQGKGAALNYLQRYQEALAAHDRAIQLDPNNVVAYNNKGAALNNLQRYQEALTACERAIQLNPNYAHAPYNKGIALHNLQRYQEALDTFNRALQLTPNDADAWQGKGVAFYALQRYQEALDAYNRALQLNSQNAGAWQGKGMTLEQLGRTAEAEQAYQKARELGYKG